MWNQTVRYSLYCESHFVLDRFDWKLKSTNNALVKIVSYTLDRNMHVPTAPACMDVIFHNPCIMLELAVLHSDFLHLRHRLLSTKLLSQGFLIKDPPIWSYIILTHCKKYSVTCVQMTCQLEFYSKLTIVSWLPLWVHYVTFKWQLEPSVIF